MQDFIAKQIDINGQIGTVTVKQYDNLSRFLHVKLADNDNPETSIFNLTGCTAKLYMDVPGSTPAYIDGEISDAEGGILSFTLPSGLTQAAGDFQCEIRIMNATEQSVISTNPFTLTVKKSIFDSAALEATPEFSVLDALTMQVYANKSRLAELVALSESGDFPSGSVESEVVDARTDHNGVTHASAGDALRSVGMAATENIIHHVTTNLLNPNEIETGKLINGALDASFSTTGTSGFISVKTGDVIRCLYLLNGDLDKIVITSYALYDAEKSLLAHGDSAVFSVTATTDGYVRVSFSKNYLPDLGVVKNKTAAEWTWEEYYEPYNTYTADFLTSETASKISVLEDLSFIKDSPFENACDVLTGDTVLRVLGTDAKRNYSISFRGDVTTVGTLIITNGNQSSYLSGWVEADDTNIKVYTKEGSSPVLVGTYPHGLNLAGKINVSIIAKKWKKADIVITTSGDENTQGGLFVQANVDWFGNHGYAFANLALGSITANTDGGHYTNCELKFYCSDYQHDLWAFGDSYFDHWPVIAIQNGYSNWAVDGASGRNSTQAFNSLSLAMQKRIPRKILWCMGMNDEDTETAVNARWLNNYNKVKTLCETNGIELILCTIPCNSRPNNYKNAIIKASGLRYVDIANAVGGEELNSSWYDGLLSGDGVHPTLLGDKVIAARFMADVPELMDVF